MITNPIMQEIKKYLMQLHTKETVKSYLLGISYFLSANPSAETYGYTDIVTYLKQLMKTYPNELTRSKQLACVKKYYDFLLQTKQREDHPCRAIYIRSPKKSVQHQTLFSSDQLEELLQRKNRYDLLEKRNKAAISLLIYQGLRSEELCNINLSDINLEDGVIIVKATHITRRRIMELKPKQILLLDSYIKDARQKLIKGEYNQLLITKKGVPFSVETVNRMLRPLRNVCFDKTLNAKTIRRSVISNWLNQKKYPLGDVQLLAGHKYPSSTEKYLREDSVSKRKLINQYHPLK